VFRDGEFEVEYPASVEVVWTSASTALRRGGFREIRGDRDALSGELKAETREGTDLSLELESVNPELTELRIRVGVRGDLQASETVYELIEAELAARAAS
jgi:hypothetical protein